MPSFDYSEDGAYFVTAVTEGRVGLFGEIRDGEMRINRFGSSVTDCWSDLSNHYPHVALDEFVVMPNHFQESSGCGAPGGQV